MPALLALLVLVALMGGVQMHTPETTDFEESDVIVSTQFGGLVKPTEQTNGTISGQKEKVEDVEVALPKIPPIVDTLSVQDLYTSKATARGTLSFLGKSYRGSAYFLLSENYSDVLNQSSDALVITVSSRASASKTYTKKITRLAEDTKYYYRFCFSAETTNCGDIVSFTTNEDYDRDDSYRLPSVSTKRAENINAEDITLIGRYKLNDMKNATAFFVYGENRARVDEIQSEYSAYSQVREYDEDLQKVRAGVSIPSSGTIERTIDELEKDTTYYYRFCVAYDDDNATGIKCGSTSSVTTDSKDRDEPTVSAQRVIVNGSSVTFSATISMQDYLDGYAFLVFGTSLDRVTDVSEEDSFSSVKPYGDALQRIALQTNFDGRDSFTYKRSDLTTGTQYYRFCVEYEAENDRGRGDLFLSCGKVELFQI